MISSFQKRDHSHPILSNPIHRWIQSMSNSGPYDRSRKFMLLNGGNWQTVSADSSAAMGWGRSLACRYAISSSKNTWLLLFGVTVFGVWNDWVRSASADTEWWRWVGSRGVMTG